MTDGTGAPSARATQLLEAAYAYVLDHGITDMSLRPLAAAIGSSPRVLLYLYESKDGLIRALLARARADELKLVKDLATDDGPVRGLRETGTRIWAWLAAVKHRPLLALWVEAYARSLTDPTGPWAYFAASTVQDWLDILAQAQPSTQRETAAGVAERTLLLAVLRGALLDLLATGDVDRVNAAVKAYLDRLR
jgi:AcrR family transcriptional regulator